MLLGWDGISSKEQPQPQPQPQQQQQQQHSHRPCPSLPHRLVGQFTSQDAIEKCKAGDTVEIEEGHYWEDLSTQVQYTRVQLKSGSRRDACIMFALICIRPPKTLLSKSQVVSAGLE